MYLQLSVPADKIRVGRDYQAVCPELQPEALRKPELLADRALLVWSPTTDIPESKCTLSYASCGNANFRLIYLQWKTTLYWQKTNMATMENKHWECCFGINTIWSALYLTWQISPLFPMNGQSKIKCSLSKHSNFTEKAFIGYVKW